jgi:hypothetical protein
VELSKKILTLNEAANLKEKNVGKKIVLSLGCWVYERLEKRVRL